MRPALEDPPLNRTISEMPSDFLVECDENVDEMDKLCYLDKDECSNLSKWISFLKLGFLMKFGIG